MTPPTPVAPVDELTGLEAARLGLYVHFPFCLSKCPYCDFASVAMPEVPQRRYTAALEKELALRLSLLGPRPTIDSIFVGGGTPSLWEPALFARFLSVARAELHFAERLEVTLEANPGASDAARFADFLAAGVGRLSIGIQSFSPRTLAALGRTHDGATAHRAIDAAHQAGFTNLSLDFIYGAPGQTGEEVEADARAAVAHQPAHLSAYALTLEVEALAEEVPLARALARGEVALPPDDAVVAMRRRLAAVYAAAGLARYEVSNYARPGLHSRHNALYWTHGAYLAVGVGATGTLPSEGGTRRRYRNHRGVEAYLSAVEAGRLPEAGEETLSPAEQFEERVAMGLRLVNGLDLEAACEEAGQPYEPRRPVVERLLAEGLAQWRAGRLALTDRGLDVHSAIAAALM